MGAGPIPVGYLTDSQRRRTQALGAAVTLFPTALSELQIRVARWIVTGRWEDD